MLVIITIGIPWVVNSVKSELKNISGIYAVHVDEVLDVQKTVTGKLLKEACQNGCYQDVRGNRIQLDETIPDAIRICFEGRDNILVVGKNVLIDKLMLSFGNRGTCRIGEGTQILGGHFLISDAKLDIGKGGLF